MAPAQLQPLRPPGVRDREAGNRARESGAPVGTLYHRFGSRDGLVSAA